MLDHSNVYVPHNMMGNETKKKIKDEKHIFTAFPRPTYEAWRQTAEKTLKGKSFEDKLMTKTYEGILLQPIYMPENLEEIPDVVRMLPGAAPYVRGTRTLGYIQQSWDVAQELSAATPEAFNRIAKHDMERGQNMIHVVLDTPTCLGRDADQVQSHRGKGLSLCTKLDVAQAFADIDLEHAPLLIQSGLSAQSVLSLLIAYMREQGKSADKLCGCIGMDPLSMWVKEGILPYSLEGVYDAMSQMTLWANRHAPNLQTVFVQGHPYHDGGGNAVQEMAFSLASAVAYIRAMQERDVDIDTSALHIRFSFSLGSNFFMEIAKLRAARMLWANIVSAFGGSEASAKMKIHGRTSFWTKTVRDPYVNLLRTTTEALAGVVGGVDSLHASPFDEALGESDAFSRRLARNTQLLLEEEAHLGKTIDPAGGSWYVEVLTDQLAQKAWKLFQHIEGKGGMVRALEEGEPQRLIEEVARTRRHNINRRKDRIVGTNVYANVKEAPIVRKMEEESVYEKWLVELAAFRSSIDVSVHRSALDKLYDAQGEQAMEAAIEAAQAGATLQEITEAVQGRRAGTTPAIVKIRTQRAAEPFEELRTAVDAYTERTGKRPQVFLANIGPTQSYKPRADFSAGFFEVGGFEVLADKGFNILEEAVREAAASTASIIVICSSDDMYPNIVPQLVQMLRRTLPSCTIFLAGAPQAEQWAIYKEAGVHHAITMQSDCYAVLRSLLHQKGIML
ncbi:methylmalonyl-CoA mutase family protein [Aneurinibacillus aneurinilyticus]|uniref:Putative methylmalonyl-CoA mutase, small subunit n=1 Tax=Aneurinibacillus aneurinilyticus ATCC 12856 TaxID=649747 RepID=U1W765_ANEAE|nr:methylmalonyl-CoA mutase family protein [Aneurinibacillus aneurinilyticus]ERI04314.1 putative methylmalonyl-CoA mutase, small subunit [Aneurinibacillus aneurinilyticus ATCC 12856]MED0708304.1 methylmalonyl-CoA mutase family protein [Aneurinibacillus aneurinilyticus]MED0722108.1 methylmalonyl-CoA mutase family protein [Aneurinibacillus aneurinilyticus]MED0733390.1 methylmalonyl-CoA mutase family protein [Aneurinibacillus aneurinilyticus]MED0741356.1 methylmalonyl-CoA mutase family protein [A